MLEKIETVPVTTTPCLLMAKGKHAKVSHFSFTGSKHSTLRKTTLSSSPPTATITSAIPKYLSRGLLLH